MRVLLTSSGITPALAAEAGKAWNWSLENRRVLHVHTASLVEDGRDQWIKPQMDVLSALGASVTDTDITAYDTREISAMIAAHDVLYMQGGDTFFLRRHLENSMAYRLIDVAVREGRTAYIGSSAGSILGSVDMTLAGFRIAESERQYQKGCPGTAWGFVPDHVHVHARPGDEDLIKATFPLLQRPVISLKDGQGVLAGGALTVIG